jgi:MFS family permease
MSRDQQRFIQVSTSDDDNGNSNDPPHDSGMNTSEGQMNPIYAQSRIDEDTTTINLSDSSPLYDPNAELSPLNSNDTTPSHNIINLWTLDNYCLPMSYIMVGTFQGLTSGVMTMFLLNIQATEAQQLTIKTLRSLPSILKIGFGFLSDTLPIYGYRRKGYMYIGWIISSLSMFCLICSGTNIPLIALFYFLFGLGFWMADVIADSIMVEKSKEEVGDNKGKLSALCYSYRFLFNMITITLVTFLYDYISVQFIFTILVLLPIFVMLPAVYFMREERYAAVNHINSQLNEIWSTVSSKAVWQPMGFVYVFSILQIG